MTAACVGQWELFDSTDVRDHVVAKRLCATCPMLATCNRLLKEAREAAAGAGPSAGPVGTWAGQLVGATLGYRVPGIPQEVMIARAAYTRGDRSEWATAGNRVYERRRYAKKAGVA